VNILPQILAKKKLELQKQKKTVSLKTLAQSVHFNRQRFVATLKKPGPSIVAEFKRASPSEGVIRSNGKVEDIATGYASAGAAALSVLTERNFFQGSEADLKSARKVSGLPVLRKDFIFDEYQLVEAKSWGADAVLLIAAILNNTKLSALLQACRRWELEAVVEVHNHSDLDRALAFGADAIGVNNRDLKTMKVDLRTSFALAEKMDGRTVFISESGLSSPEEAAKLYRAGYQGFLIGTHFMKQPGPGAALKKFLTELRKLTDAKS
jgi:indole-3-glycerol phosphate synthase